LPGAFEPPQEEQITASGLPQSPQNFFPAGFSAPQLGQAIISKSLTRNPAR
jgi:hypothetical protein